MSNEEIKPTEQQVTRAVIRKWIELHASLLETAQADGKLARVKLDLRDKIQTEFPPNEAKTNSHMTIMFQEELEAFCADMRLASVTVQTQVERTKNSPFLRALGWIVFVLIVFFIIILIGVGASIAGS